MNKLKIYIFLCLMSICLQGYAKSTQKADSAELVLGAQRTELYLPLLKNKRVGLVVNQTSVFKSPLDSSPQHLVDFLVEHNIDVRVLFAPEHGVRGNKSAGEHIKNGQDAKTGIPIQSIYGENKTPPTAVLNNLDVIVFDIQDVGTRFYTYISSMHYMMQASAEHNIEFLVLDRPNPNGEFIDGPVLDMQFQSFVGMHPIPVLHGLTVAELAKMIVGQKWIEKAPSLPLVVIPMLSYTKDTRYEPPIPPSPNLPNYQSIRLYPSLCFFEPTAVSIGRGTDFPFQVTGHNMISLGDFAFTPVSKPEAAKYPKLENTAVTGMDLRQATVQGLDLSLLLSYFEAFTNKGADFYTSPAFFDKLAGTDKLRKSINKGLSEVQIKRSWQSDLQQYKKMRQAYLLYPQSSSQSAPKH